jgi:hypothetical protein
VTLTRPAGQSAALHLAPGDRHWRRVRAGADAQAMIPPERSQGSGPARQRAAAGQIDAAQQRIANGS